MVMSGSMAPTMTPSDLRLAVLHVPGHRDQVGLQPSASHQDNTFGTGHSSHSGLEHIRLQPTKCQHSHPLLTRCAHPILPRVLEQGHVVGGGRRVRVGMGQSGRIGQLCHVMSSETTDVTSHDTP